MIENREILDQLLTLCKNAETGTFFITTTDNRACHVVIEQGRITAMSYGPLRGEQVASALQGMEVAGFSFKTGIKMPLPSRASIGDNLDVLSLLGATSDPDPEMPDLSALEQNRIYRGVSQEDTAFTEQEQPAVKQSTRIYRGHKQED